VSGTQADDIPIPNTPIADNGGNGLATESYDVRANEVMSPDTQPMQEESQDESFWTKFGRSLAYQAGSATKPAQSPPIETQQVEASEGLPNIAPPEQLQPDSPNNLLWSSVGKGIKDYVKADFNQEEGKKASDRNRRIVEDARKRAQGINPDVERQQQAEVVQQKVALDQQQMEKAQQNPMKHVVYGATDAAANAPEIQKEFKTITGIDFHPGS